MASKVSQLRILPANDVSLNNASWEIFQLMSEFIEGFERLARISQPTNLFTPNRPNSVTSNTKLVTEIVQKLSEAGFSVVSNGQSRIMEVVINNDFNQKGFEKLLANPLQDIGSNFVHHYSADKIKFVKHAWAQIVLPGETGTLDELAEILTLVQTGKTRHIPILLVNSDFWNDLMKWLENTLVKNRTISPQDMELLKVVDKPDEVVDTIFAHYQNYSLKSPVKDQENLLQL